MDPNTAMETFGESAKAVTKIGQIIERFIGPYCTRKQADADAYADKKKLQTIRDNPDMDIVYVDGKLNVKQRTPEALAFRATKRLDAEAIRQQNNIENVLECAIQEISQVNSVSDEPVDDDWITRFFSIVKDISNQEMQYVWGKILAGEISSPKSFSLRTLETLRNISSDEAKLFQKIIPLIVYSEQDYFITSEDKILSNYNIPFSEILSLDECGLINSTGNVLLTFSFTSNNEEFIFSDEFMIVVSICNKNASNISTGIYSLTKAGQELYKILPHDSNKEYMCEFAECIFEENKPSVKLSVHYRISDSKNTNIYSEKPIVLYGEETITN